MRKIKARRQPAAARVPNNAEARETLAATRTMARAYATHHVERDAINLARSFALAIADHWWTRLRPSTQVPLLLRPFADAGTFAALPDPLSGLAKTIGEAAALLPADEAGYHLGLAYTSMLPSEYRTRHGIYYTPPALAERMLDQVTAAGLDWATAHVLDPACGGGAFLAPVAKRIMTALAHCEPAILVNNVATRLAGFELDPFAGWLSQITLDAVMLPVTTKAGRQLPPLIQTVDTLTLVEPARKFDLVIGNPPYGKIKLAAQQRAQFQRALYGHANLYGLFMDIAIRHATPDGLLAYLTPTSFLAGEYFKNLRALLAVEARPVTIDFVSLRKGVFEDVLQEVILATYKRRSKRKTADIHIAKPNGDSRLTVTAAGQFKLPADGSRPWLMPRDTKHVPLLVRLNRFKQRLADWGYTVSTGPLVWNRHKPQLVSSPGKGDTLPLIWAESITNDGRFLWRAEKRNHAPYFKVKPGDEWLIVREPCVLLQRTTAKEQARRLIAAALPAEFLSKHKAVVIENHLNMIRATSAKPKVSPLVLAAVLNSDAADRAFRCVSGSVAVSAYELEALPLPNAAQTKTLAALIAKNSGRAAIEAECARLFDGEAHK